MTQSPFSGHSVTCKFVRVPNFGPESAFFFIKFAMSHHFTMVFLWFSYRNRHMSTVLVPVFAVRHWSRWRNPWLGWPSRFGRQGCHILAREKSGKIWDKPMKNMENPWGSLKNPQNISKFAANSNDSIWFNVCLEIWKMRTSIPFVRRCANHKWYSLFQWKIEAIGYFRGIPLLDPESSQ